MTNIIAVKITWFTVLISDWDHSGGLVARVCGCGQCGLWKRFVFVCVCVCVGVSTGKDSAGVEAGVARCRVGRMWKLELSCALY